MQTKEWRWEGKDAEEKATWKEGPWTTEPDKMQWQDEETGLPCLIVRNRSGALCGYVGVPKGHPFHAVDYHNCSKEECGEVDEDGIKSYHSYCDHSPSHVLDAHGGITFSGFCQESEHGICHVVEPGEDDKVWWLGFDTAHGGDIIPAFTGPKMEAIGITSFTDREPGASYKNIAYVKRQVKELARQLKGIAV